MIKELLEMTNTSQSIAKQNNLKIKKKALCHHHVIPCLFLASIFPEPRFFPSFLEVQTLILNLF